jgi:hypothetical protein
MMLEPQLRFPIALVLIAAATIGAVSGIAGWSHELTEAVTYALALPAALLIVPRLS